MRFSRVSTSDGLEPRVNLHGRQGVAVAHRHASAVPVRSVCGGERGKGENSVNHPTVSHARDICGQLKARGVIVLAFTPDGNVAGSSYGKTEEERRRFGLAMDGIINAIHRGSLRVKDAD